MEGAIEELDLEENNEGSLKQSEILDDLGEIVLLVKGMTCQSCVNAIQNGVKTDTAIVSVEVSLPKDQVSVVYKRKDISKEEIIGIIEGLGYEVDNNENLINNFSTTYVYIGEMKDFSDADAIQKSLEKLDGVLSVHVNHEDNSGTVKHLIKKVSVDDLLTNVSDMGYQCSLKAISKLSSCYYSILHDYFHIFLRLGCKETMSLVVNHSCKINIA